MCAWEIPRVWSSGELVTASLMNSQLKGDLDILKTAINDSGQLEFTDATELTIASGVVTVTQNYHKIDVETGSSDDLDTITVAGDVAAGFILHLRPESGARTVVIKNATAGAANIDIGADVTLDESYKTYSLVYDGTNWRPFIYAATPTFASISPLTTRGDILYSSSGTVTGTRLAKGAANTVLGSDGTDTAWQLKPLTTRGDILYGSSGVPTGTRLAIGSATYVLTSDGTDAAWAAAAGAHDENCKVFNNADQSIANATAVALAWNSEQFDTDTMHDTSTNNSRITFTTAGTYIITANLLVDMAGGATTNSWTLWLKVNGTEISRVQWANITASEDRSVLITDAYVASADDYVEVVVYNNSGVTGTVRGLVSSIPASYCVAWRIN